MLQAEGANRVMDGCPSDNDRALAAAQELADALLYEGYLLYPYRRSSGKNRVRWQFGVLAPPAWARTHGSAGDSVAGSAESWWQQTECLLEPEADATLRIRVRFLQVQHRTVERLGKGTYHPVDTLDTGGQTYLCFDEAVPQEFAIDVPVADLRGGPRRVRLAAPGGRDIEPLGDHTPGGRLVRQRWPVSALVTVSTSACPPPSPARRLRVRIENLDRSTGADMPRAQALRRSLVSTHTLVSVDRGRFLSLLEPPLGDRSSAEACRNVRTFPVLLDDGGTDRLVLSSPIILYDHPRIAPESPGDLHDATEIDEILSLRTLTLTDAEKSEARATDPRSAAIIDRVEAMSPQDLARLHGTIREPRDAGDREPQHESVTGFAADKEPASVVVAGTRISRGSRLRLRPNPHGTDAQDMFLDGRTARVEDILLDVDGSHFLAVTVDDDPGAGLHHWYGRLRHFRTDEVEPLAGSETPT
jgi:hypothetical protein